MDLNLERMQELTNQILLVKLRQPEVFALFEESPTMVQLKEQAGKHADQIKTALALYENKAIERQEVVDLLYNFKLLNDRSMEITKQIGDEHYQQDLARSFMELQALSYEMVNAGFYDLLDDLS